MTVSWVLGFVQGKVPAEVKEEVWAVGNFPSHYLQGAMGEKGRYGIQEVSCGLVYLWGRTDQP